LAEFSVYALLSQNLDLKNLTFVCKELKVDYLKDARTKITTEVEIFKKEIQKCMTEIEKEGVSDFKNHQELYDING
jgi:biotin operon repressor